jgi:hypothetical protein
MTDRPRGEARAATPDGRGGFEVGELLAVQGKPGCTDIRCTRINGECVGWHCPRCGAPTSSQGGCGCADREETGNDG